MNPSAAAEDSSWRSCCIYNAGCDDQACCWSLQNPTFDAQYSTALNVSAADAGYASVVEVVQGKVEELSLEAQVDVLVSEPMGTLLVNERMLETYLYARNRYLKKSGRMFPVSKIPCTLHLATHCSRQVQESFVSLHWQP